MNEKPKDESEAPRPLDDLFNTSYEYTDTEEAKKLKWTGIALIAGLGGLSGLPLLAFLGSAIGGEVLDETVNITYRHFLSDRSTLNEDISWVIEESFSNTLKIVEDEWRNHPLFLRLGQGEDSLAKTHTGHRQLTGDQQATLEFFRDLKSQIMPTLGSVNLEGIKSGILSNIITDANQSNANLQSVLATTLAELNIGLHPDFILFVSQKVPDYWRREIFRTIMTNRDRNNQGYKAYMLIEDRINAQHIKLLEHEIQETEGKVEEICKRTDALTELMDDLRNREYLSLEEIAAIRHMISEGLIPEISDDQGRNLEYARSLYSRGKYVEAKRFFEEVMRDSPVLAQKVEAMQGLANLDSISEDYLGAIDRYSEIISLCMTVYQERANSHQEGEVSAFEEMQFAERTIDQVRTILTSDSFPQLKEIEDSFIRRRSTGYMELREALMKNLDIERYKRKTVHQRLAEWVHVKEIQDENWLSFFEENPTLKTAQRLAKHANYAKEDWHMKAIILLATQAINLFELSGNASDVLHENMLGIAQMHSLLAKLYFRTNMFEIADVHLTRALEIYKEQNEFLSIGILYQELGEIQIRNRFSRLAKGNLEESIKYLKIHQSTGGNVQHILERSERLLMLCFVSWGRIRRN